MGWEMGLEPTTTGITIHVPSYLNAPKHGFFDGVLKRHPMQVSYE